MGGVVPKGSARASLPLRIAGAYLLIALAGIIVSDVVVDALSRTPEEYAQLDLVKDSLFVLLTAVALFVHLRWAMGRLDRAEEAIDRASERQRLSSGVLHAFNARTLRGEPLRDNLRDLCGQLVDKFGFRLAWVARRDPDGGLSVRASAGPGAGFLDEVRMRWDASPEGQGAVGEAIRTGVPQLADVEHPDCAPFREAAVRHGIRSTAVLPLGDGGATIGALAVCSSGAEEFAPEFLSVLRHFADEVALSVADAVKQETLTLQTAALEASSNAVVICARDGTILWANPAFETLSGWKVAEAVGQTPRILKSGAHAEGFYRAMWDRILAGETWSGEILNRRRDGSIYTEEQTITPVKDASGAVSHFISIRLDVTARRKEEAEVRRLSLADPLTGLANRRSLQVRLEEAVEAARAGRPSALLLLDLDNFRVINETLGHRKGDQVLATLAPVFSGALPPGGFLARVEGDEFGILLEGGTVADARALADALRTALAHFQRDELQPVLDVTFSAGVAPVEGTVDAAAVYALADAALLSAREQGIGRLIVRRTGRETESGIVTASRWGFRIREALARGRFVLAYQPVVRLSDRSTQHFEVLIRMVGEAGEEIPPNLWVPTAERLGLMPQVDRWALGRALDVLDATDDGVRLFVNISGRSLGERELLDAIEAELRRRAPAPGRLGFEITETAAVLDLASSREWIGRLKALGCRFALDDFGVGFSSFAYLRALSADYVKVDGSFVRNLQTDPTGRALILAVKTVSREFGMEVVAESVESEAIAERLRDLGVEYGQGYLFSGPLPQPTAPVPPATSSRSRTGP